MIAKQLENSEVFPFSSVAVAVMSWPVVVAVSLVSEKLACPLLSVAAEIESRKTAPSPLPEPSQASFAKNWSTKKLLGVLFRLPRIRV